MKQKKTKSIKKDKLYDFGILGIYSYYTLKNQETYSRIGWGIYAHPYAIRFIENIYWAEREKYEDNIERLEKKAIKKLNLGQVFLLIEELKIYTNKLIDLDKDYDNYVDTMEMIKGKKK